MSSEVAQQKKALDIRVNEARSREAAAAKR
jgi:hypothetical protein